MKEISSPQKLSALREICNGNYSYTDLYYWEHKQLNFTEGKAQRNEDPLKILECKQGKCGELAILYVALCLSQGYEARLVTNVFADHEWAEVKVDNQWIHVDPSLTPNDERAFNHPFMYESWNEPIFLILAIEKSSFEDVTSTYRSGFWINIVSIEMFSLVSFISFTVFALLTISYVREAFYKLSFQYKGIIKSLGELYERNLHHLYVLRFIFMFLFPLAVAVLFFGIRDQDNFLNLLVVGLALVAFSAIEMPSLTKPKVFISVVEDCKDEKECKYKETKKRKKECMHKVGRVCKKNEMHLEARTGEQRLILFRIANLSLHTLKNCTAIFTFPPTFELLEYDDSSILDKDFQKKYLIQKRNNACLFPASGISCPPGYCIIFPVLVKIKGKAKDDCIGIEVSSESTWGGIPKEFPVKSV